MTPAAGEARARGRDFALGVLVWVGFWVGCTAAGIGGVAALVAVT